MPNTLILDNRLQFNSKAFQKYCSDLEIKNRYSTLAYPQSNGQAEGTNKAIVNGLMKRLEKAKSYPMYHGYTEPPLGGLPTKRLSFLLSEQKW